MAPVGSMLWRTLRTYQVYGANTEVGKTVFTTILCKAARSLYEKEKISYLKPVSTGPEDEADERSVSPHTAAKGRVIPSDRRLLRLIHEHASQKAASGPGWLFIETAGGVHSPSPSGTTQADLYMPLRCPVVLVGDSKLGGISLTISAFESLRLRGYDVEMILMFPDRTHGNHQYLSKYFSDQHVGLPVLALNEPPPPQGRQPSAEAEFQVMSRYYQEASGGDVARNALTQLEEKHDARVTRLESMAAEAHRKIWYPFTQQRLLQPEHITTIDAARGDFFQTLVPQAQRNSAAAAAPVGGGVLLQPSFDGSASWWTQGLGHSNPSLTLAAAYAAGRYGHVMFAEAVHEPALALAESLLAGIRNPRLQRVFYSDNGSTGVEVALKMALRATRARYGWDARDPIIVIGLKGGYHGDTMGAMDCAEPGVFNEKVEWYDGKGVWFDYPTVKCVRGRWVVEAPEAMRNEDGVGSNQEFGSLSEVFDITEREQRREQERYENYVAKELKRHVDHGRRFGALLMEPVVIGAGGMLLVTGTQNWRPSGDEEDDAKTTWAGLPVIFDEVFTGVYRLGRFSAGSFLAADADVSVHAKLLTGGVVPLCATLASESVFRAFASDDKTDALLHGHSYTAHPVGCQVALESLRQLRALDEGGRWDWAKARKSNVHASDDGSTTLSTQSGIHKDSKYRPVVQDAPWSIWSAEFVELVSRQAGVAGVWALGSVLSIHMDAGGGGAGYKSTAAVRIRDSLRRGARDDRENTWNVHSRVLGNVLYIMGSQKSMQEDIREIEELVRERLKSLQ
ncbi:hypothetical protein DL764_000159 [Monosporascus ibericus]|uniref:Dethiobiotin synthase n=1 Tax=Monosporascus ibericus TaxID=155417 RepID=A0A4Q4TZW6_9PEZI|nr:hypothetical protein DL764_000159 [Monosporascus ibericus]